MLKSFLPPGFDSLSPIIPPNADQSAHEAAGWPAGLTRQNERSNLSETTHPRDNYPSRLERAMKILFVAGFGPISRDVASTHHFFSEVLGIPFGAEDGDYYHTEQLPGCKAFALWPLAQAAESCFGTNQWPDSVPVPQAWLEFDVADIASAGAELREQGYQLLVENRLEPWGQRVTRLLGPNGLLVGITETPWLRDDEA
jgi:catechol 2,3-dioxygenase-like lactoylglutathione lyase family enzyme